MEKIRSFYNFIYHKFFLVYFAIYAYFNIPFESKIIIFDIDNTLAKTRESNNTHLVSEILPNKNLCDVSGQLNDLDSYSVLYMSVRPWSSFNKTKEWLDLNIKSNKVKKLFFVRTPSYKVKAISHTFHNRPVLLIDDMSYDINKEVFLFNSVIQEINGSEILYLNIDFIKKSYNLDPEYLFKKITDLFHTNNS